jgi:exodeoxyribonuclease VII small subunit
MKKNDFNFENGIKSLEDIVRKLENPETGLDESIELYKNGMTLLRNCTDKLEKAELRIKEITSDGKLE